MWLTEKVRLREDSRMKKHQEVPQLAVDLDTAATITSLCRRTLENHIRANRLKAVKVGRRTLVRVRDLEAFLRSDQPSPAPKSNGNDDVAPAQ